MVEPEKPFACTMPDCGMTFTNEDHLNVHTKKHDMVLQFGCEQKAAFVADQTPTPTRFIRNCEEVGLFQDLQNVNPFDEGFKRAIETKQGILSLDHGCTPSEELHTPQMFPLLDPGDSVFSTTNNHRNITISRSSSDETGAIKEFETTRISKLTNEVTTISRIVEKHDDTPKHKETLNSVSYTNNVIKIQSNVEIRKDTDRTEDVIKDGIVCKDAHDRLQVDLPPIMSQKSIDFVVDSLTTDYVAEKVVKETKKHETKDSTSKIEQVSTKKAEKNRDERVKKEDYEVILKLPSGQQIKLVSAEEKKKDTAINAKDLLKKVIKEKVESQKLINSVNFHIPTVIPAMTSGTLIPVTIVNTSLVNTHLGNTNLVNTNSANTSSANSLVNTNLANTTLVNANLVNTNLPNTSLVNTNLANTSLVNATLVNPLINTSLVNRTIVNTNYTPKLPLRVFDKRSVRRKCPENVNNVRKKSKESDPITEMESRSAASRRYRAKLKETMTMQALENKQLKEINEKLQAEKALLQTLIVDHMKRCHCPDDLRELKEKIKNLNNVTGIYEIK